MVVLIVLTLLMCLTACDAPNLASQPQLSNMQMIQNPSNTSIQVGATLLEVYEDQTEPPGSNLGANRPVGHAIVRLRLENLSLEAVNLQGVTIEIRATDRHNCLMSQEIGTITLGGRQILEPGFHLTNHQGFEGTKTIHAIVTYVVDNKPYQIKSPVSSVVINP